MAVVFSDVVVVQQILLQRHCNVYKCHGASDVVHLFTTDFHQNLPHYGDKNLKFLFLFNLSVTFAGEAEGA
jgi:hypothetical protein